MSELNFLQAIILSVIQAITEFIPVSSSAHLLLPSKLLGWPDQGQFFDISVHFGSLVAVILHFRDSLLSRNFYTSNFFLLLIVATIPIIAFTLIFNGITDLRWSLTSIAISNILFAFLLLISTKINVKKVGVSGYSRGGNLSIMAAEKRLRDILVSKDLYFAASQPRSAECGITGMFRNPTPVKETKIWYVHGLAEDYTLPGPCVDLMEKMQAKGADIEIDLREGWYHLFTGNYEPEIEKRTQYFWKCPNFYTEDDGNPNKEFFDLILKNTKIKSLDEFNELSRKNQRKAFKTMFKGLKKEKCIGKGVTEGGNHGKTFMPEYLAFWKENLLN